MIRSVIIYQEVARRYAAAPHTVDAAAKAAAIITMR
jgi:hypothetical protein